MNKLLTVATIALTYYGTNVTANACSMAGCLNHGVELHRTFVVMVKHAGKPLAGVAVQVSGSGRQFTVFSTTEGSAQITDLLPGDYWLYAQFLGIGAAYECFHISDRPTRKAKRKLTYKWGDDAPATQRIAGRLIDSQPAKGGTPLWNLVHRVEVPIAGASLELKSPDTVAVYTAMSGDDGTFAFHDVPNGTYVLHIEGGSAGARTYDATDQLVEIDPKATRKALLLARRDASGGSCGGTSLELLSAN
jgi:hypothetical protein